MDGVSYLTNTAVCDALVEVEADAVVLEVLLQVPGHHAAVVHFLLQGEQRSLASPLYQISSPFSRKIQF